METPPHRAHAARFRLVRSTSARTNEIYRVIGGEDLLLSGVAQRAVRRTLTSTLRCFAGVLALAGLLWCATLPVAPSAFALGPNAMVYPTGWNNNSVTRGDDNTYPTVNLPFTMVWNGVTYTNVNINMNGNCTFGTAFTEYNPNKALKSTARNIMAPFWADVDTQGSSGLCYYSDAASTTACQVNGRQAFIVTWQGVGRYSQNVALGVNYFQLVIVNRADTGAGNFDFWFNYDQIKWDFPTAASTAYPHAGWAFADGSAGYELAGGGTSGAMLDTGPSALINDSLNSGGQLGRYVFSVRGGKLPNVAPDIASAFTTKTLEANSLNGYTGYSGATDATATDGDGTVASFTRSPVAGSFLPIGPNTITWTATDDDASTTVVAQTINVVDTTPPDLPTAFSPSHTASAWSGVGTMTVNWTTSTDVASQLDGYSYRFSRDTTALPDAVTETYATAAGVTSTTTVDSEAFTAATWPADWPVSTTATYIRLAATRSHSAANVAEVYATSTTRRTGSFQQAFDLSDYTTATVSWWDNRSAFNNAGADYERVDYSTDGGTTWTTLYTTSAVQVASGWVQRTASLPCTSSVIVRFGGSVNAAAEWVDFDDIVLSGYRPAPNQASAAPGDGVWYFNVRAVDTRGNWNPVAAWCGPYWIESFPPITTDNVPAGWTNSFTTASLTATDAGSGVDYTRYQLDASAWTTYTAPFAISAEGTHTVRYFSADEVGHIETTHTATLRLDRTAPTTPTITTASAVSTTSAEVVWTGSTDAVSGVAYYSVYRNGSEVATVAAGPYTDTGLTAGATYSYWVIARDYAGNASAASASASATVPTSQIWMTLDPTAVSIGTIDPGIVSTLTSATAVTVGGVGNFAYDLSVYADNFANVATASVTPTMPANLMSYRMYGTAVFPLTPFSTTSQMVTTSNGTKYVWSRPYYFDYTLNVPWAFAPGTYTTKITYSVVAH